MRSNSIAVRLNYSIRWSEKVIFNRDYFKNLKRNLIIKGMLSDLLFNLKKYLVYSHALIHLFANNRICVYVYLMPYAFKTIQRAGKRRRKKKRGLNFYFIKNFYTGYLSKIDFLLHKSLSRVDFKYILINRKYNANLISHIVINKLASSLKLYRVMHNLGRSFINKKGRVGALFICSGRFDRKQRATFKTFIYGKISLNSFKYAIDYSYRSVVLKYGICGIKCWVI